MITKITERNIIASQYNEGDFIDVFDRHGDWRVGYILSKSIETQTFKIRIDGWHSKYDEVLSH